MRREGSPEVAIARPGRTGLRKIRNITSLLRRLFHQPLVFWPLLNVKTVVILVFWQGLSYVVCSGLAEWSMSVISMGRLYPAVVFRAPLVGCPTPLSMVPLLPAESA
jgi:hypothetical protein